MAIDMTKLQQLLRAQPTNASTMPADSISSQFQNGVQQPGVQSVSMLPSNGPGMQPGLSQEEKELRRRIQEKLQKGISRREEDVLGDRAALTGQENKDGFQQADLSGLYQLAQAAGGDTSVGAKYSAPKDDTQTIAMLRDKLSTHQGAIADDELAMLKFQLENKNSDKATATQNRFLASQDAQTFKQVKNAFDEPMKTYNDYQQQRALVASAIESGDVLRLNSALSSLARMQGEKGALAEGDIERAVPSTVLNKLQNYAARIASGEHVKADPAVLKVLSSNLGALDEAAKAKVGGMLEQQRSLYEGAPGQYGIHAQRLYDKALPLLQGKSMAIKSGSGGLGAGKANAAKKSLSEMTDAELDAYEAQLRGQ